MKPRFGLVRAALPVTIAVALCALTACTPVGSPGGVFDESSLLAPSSSGDSGRPGTGGAAPGDGSITPSDGRGDASTGTPTEPSPGDGVIDVPPAPTPLPAPNTPQSGTLTAGSFDDNLNFDVFRAFVDGVKQQAQSELGISVDVGTRALIRVVNDSGEPIGNADIVVRTPSQQQQAPAVLLRQPSGTDGAAVFFTAIDGAGSASSFEVVVTPRDGGAPVTVATSLSDLEWTVTLAGAASRPPAELDLAFVVDATGSMGDELEFLKSEVSSIAGAVADLFPDVTQRYALIVYRDAGDLYVTRTFDFTPSLDTFRANLAPQRAEGGGDWPEAMHAALADAANLSWSGGAAARVMFLIADAPPHAEFAADALAQTLKLRSKGVALYPVAASGIGVDGELVMRLGALLTHSEYLFLTDDSGVGHSHETPHIPCYHVQRLDQLMIRMVSAELAGRRIEAEPSQIIRTVGNPVNGVCQGSGGQQ